MQDAAPTPKVNPNPMTTCTTGNTMETAAIWLEPSQLMKYASTTLYKAETNIPKITGRPSFSRATGTFSSLNS